MTATAVCTASAEPPTVLACINRLATTHGAVAKSRAFCVNVLRAEDWELSTTFSGAQSGEARFKSRDWTRLPPRPPGLVGAPGLVGRPGGEKLPHRPPTPFPRQGGEGVFRKKSKPPALF